jgi:hypothetical protein
MSDSVLEYVDKRAELLAHLVLTRRKDVTVVPVGQPDVGIDYFVRVMHPIIHGQVLPQFGVEVKGTSEPLRDEQIAGKHANHLIKNRHPEGLFLFPIILMLFSVESDEGYYCWLMEPLLSKESPPSLNRVSSLKMTKIGKKTLDEIIAKVERWFEATAELLVKSVPAAK